LTRHALPITAALLLLVAPAARGAADRLPAADRARVEALGAG